MKNARIVVLGMGMMGRSIAEGLVRAHHPKRGISGTTRTRGSAARLGKELGIAVGADNVAAVAGADVVVFALKPMQVLEVARELAAAGALAPRTLVVSIAAGVTTAQLEEILGPRVAVVRAMPNT
ncbi:MAG: pyrroline-5-carboxylate reductase, partial [Acidobacteriota bacterium]|nr:pyrroline-5-carboxylate reductase [Acidobacteriota bacterium]